MYFFSITFYYKTRKSKQQLKKKKSCIKIVKHSLYIGYHYLLKVSTVIDLK